MRTHDQFLGRTDFPDQLGQLLRFLGAVPVGDGHPLIFRMDGSGAVHLHNGLHHLFPSPVFAAGHNMPGGVSPEQGLDVQHCADGGGGAADPAGAFEKVQVIHGEILQQVHGFFIQNIGGFSGGFALVSQVGGTAGEQSGAESGAQGIHNPHGPLGEILCQLLRRNPGRLDGSADAGGHSHIHHIPSRFQFRAEGLQK